MAIPVSRNAMPYVAATMSFFVTLVMTSGAVLARSPRQAYLVAAVAVLAAANGVRIWRTYRLVHRAMLYGLVTMLVVIGTAAIAVVRLASK